MRLVIEQGELAGQDFPLQQPTIVIGREPSCDIALQEHLVSRQHARLQQSPQGWMLTDLGSTNGTFVNERQISAGEATPLKPGDRITIGNTILVLQGEASQPAPVAQGRRAAIPRPALLIAGAIVLVIVVVGLVILLVSALRPKEETTTPGGNILEPLEQIGTALPVPTLIEGVATALPALPTQLEELTTALPIPTELEEVTTALPIPTQLQDLVTSMPTLEIPKLPMQALGTPSPPEATAPPASPSSGGVGQ
jgi:pSer/pThr/pTyr-binding forkhead associated (FHA) protein